VKSDALFLIDVKAGSVIHDFCLFGASSYFDRDPLVLWICHMAWLANQRRPADRQNNSVPFYLSRYDLKMRSMSEIKIRLFISFVIVLICRT
jgi:hypothetical protein